MWHSRHSRHSSVCREQYNIYTDVWKQKTLFVENNTIFTQMLENKRPFLRLSKLAQKPCFPLLTYIKKWKFWYLLMSIMKELNVYFFKLGKRSDYRCCKWLYEFHGSISWSLFLIDTVAAMDILDVHTFFILSHVLSSLHFQFSFLFLPFHSAFA